MFNRPYVAATLLAALTLVPVAPAFAAGEILITHAKALAGNVTPGDTAGYPVTISIPGNFQLASNLFVAANKIGIQVTGANATIDLNGFTMQGSNVAWYGITGGVNGVTIENGTITRFKFDGINGAGAEYWIVEGMRVVENARNGIRVGGDSSVRGSTVTENGAYGVLCGLRCIVEANNISGNDLDGLFIGSGIVLGNVINGNTSYGLQAGTGTGFGNNSIAFNGVSPASAGIALLHPNACLPACP